jgi:hypothetical protein
LINPDGGSISFVEEIEHVCGAALVWIEDGALEGDLALQRGSNNLKDYREARPVDVARPVTGARRRGEGTQ